MLLLMLAVMSSHMVSALPISKLQIIDIATCLCNDRQLQVAIAVRAAGQDPESIASSAEDDPVSLRRFRQHPELSDVRSAEALLLAP